MSTIVTVRPVAEVHRAGWNINGGPTEAWDAIADVADAATYIRTGLAFSQLRVRLDDDALPAGALIISAITRLQARAEATSSHLLIAFNDRVATVVNIPFSGSYSLVSATSLQPTVAEVAAGIILRLNGNAIGIRVHEAYIDIKYAEVPVVDVTAPTGTIAVTQPTVTWTFTGDYAQERFHIKIFSSSQFGAVGFDEDTSTPVYDSSTQIDPIQFGTGNVSASEVFVPTVNLPSGDSYRFYVRAAQKVGSVTQWSAWDFTTATVTVTPPPTPTITATGQDSQGRIKVTVTDTGTPTWEFVILQRTSDGGVTWTPVRSADRVAVSGTTFVVDDYETGNGEAVQYRAQAIIADPGGDIASAWSAVTGTKSWDSSVTWLKSLTLPTSNLEVLINGIPTLKRRLPSNAIDVAGRADPIVRSDVRRLTEGTVTFAVVDTSALDSLLALLDRSEVLLLQTPETDGFGSKYVAIGDVDENRISRLAVHEPRLVVCPFTEVVAPVGEVITFGTTWEEVIDEYATWTALQTANASWSQLINAHL